MTQQQNTIDMTTLNIGTIANFETFHSSNPKKNTSLKAYLKSIFQSFGSFAQKKLKTVQLKKKRMTAKAQENQAQWIQRKQFAQKLLQYIEETSAYQQPELSLTSLAQTMNTTPHYLSKVINEQLNCNFTDFVNQYRVHSVQEKLKLAAYSHYSILAIGLGAGFNSKSTFYSVFKKHTGMTPSQYRKQTVIELNPCS